MTSPIGHSKAPPHMASSDTDEESGGIQAGAASPRGRARGSTPQSQSSIEQDRAGGAFTRPGPDDVDGDDDDDDDGVGPASEGACGIWVGLLARTLLSVVSALVSAALVVLYPLYLLTPSIITEFLFKGVFRIGYLVYLTPVGAWLHSRGLKPNEQAHSVPPPPLQLSTCTVTVVPILQNNYAYLIVDRATGRAALVDPADPHAAVRAVETARCELTHILTTHHHHDHAGGNTSLVAAVLQSKGRALTVVGGARDQVPGCTLKVKDGDIVRLGATAIRVIDTPCHTKGHVVYCLLRSQLPPGSAGELSPGQLGSPLPSREVEAVFSGDTVFVGGVGAFFHGDARDMERNLMTSLAPCPDDALLLCGHEYTVENLRFAAWVEPDNAEVVGTYLAATAKRNLGESTVPSTLGQERRTNPYFRTTDWRLHAAVAHRRASLQARQGRNVLRRMADSVIGASPPRGAHTRSSVGGSDVPPHVQVVSPQKLYGQLQELLASGAWQQFKLKGRTAASQRRRAAAVAVAVELGRQNRLRAVGLAGGDTAAGAPSGTV